MTRIKSTSNRKSRKNKILRANSKNKGNSSRLYRKAIEQYIQDGFASYNSNKTRVRLERLNHIKNINNICKSMGTSYSTLSMSLKKNLIFLNKKIVYLFLLNNTNIIRAFSTHNANIAQR